MWAYKANVKYFDLAKGDIIESKVFPSQEKEAKWIETQINIINGRNNRTLLDDWIDAKFIAPFYPC